MGAKKRVLCLLAVSTGYAGFILDSQFIMLTQQTSFDNTFIATGGNSLPRSSNHSSPVSLPINVERNVSNHQSSSDAFDASETTDRLFSTIWPQIQKALCPRNKPNVASGGHLFRLAAKELNISNYNMRAWTVNFFSGLFDNKKGKCRTIPKANTQVCYIPIWKCGTKEIWEYLQAVLGNETAPDARMDRCVFTVVRDPVERFLSGYNEIQKRIKFRYVGVAREYPFRGKPMASENRFVQFVVDFLQETGHHHFLFMHVYSMSRVLTMGNTMAYLPSMHNLTFTLPSFLKKECRGFGVDDNRTLMDAMPQEGRVQKMRLSGNDPLGSYKASKNVWKRQGATSRALCAINAMDYACWKDLEGVPPVCQDVFTSDDFVNSFLPPVHRIISNHHITFDEEIK